MRARLALIATTVLLACAPEEAFEVEDAGPESASDAGAPDAADDAPEDAGEPPDAAEPEDAGVPEEDAGVTEEDAGVTEVDAGEPVDAGPPIDPDPIIPIEGFGAATRGGWQPGHDLVRVTSLDDSGPGTLREALNSGDLPRIVRFDVDGTIVLAGPLIVPSNMTIDGRGRQIVLSGKGLIIPGTDDVIVTHLTIENVLPESEDGIRIGDPSGPSERVVIDHVTIRHTDGKGDSAFVDEAISVVFGARAITIAWCRIEAWEKVILIGNGDAPAGLDRLITLTMHHTWTRDTGRRHPQARYGLFDFFNNFWDGWRMYGWYWEPPYRDAFGMLCQDSCRLIAENNLFARKPDSKDVLSRANDATLCQTGGTLDERGSKVAPGNTATLRFGAACPTGVHHVRPYAATIDPADDSLRLRLLAEAGNVP